MVLWLGVILLERFEFEKPQCVGVRGGIELAMFAERGTQVNRAIILDHRNSSCTAPRTRKKLVDHSRRSGIMSSSCRKGHRVVSGAVVGGGSVSSF